MWNTLTVIIISLFVVAMIMYGKNRMTESFEPRNPEFDDLLLTAYPKKFKCADCIDKLPLHIRVGRSGGNMYMSYYPPTEANCRMVNCSKFMYNVLDPRSMSHYNPHASGLNVARKYPHRSKLSYPEWKRNAYCWMC